MRRRHAPPPFEVMSQNWKSASESFDEEGQDGVSQMSAGQSPMRDSNRSVSSKIAEDASGIASPFLGDRNLKSQAKPKAVPKSTEPTGRSQFARDAGAVGGLGENVANSDGKASKAKSTKLRKIKKVAARRTSAPTAKSVGPDQVANGTASGESFVAICMDVLMQKAHRTRRKIEKLIDRAPVSLRVPKGYLVSGLAVGLSIVLVAYWIGATRDNDSGDTTTPQDRNLAAIAGGDGRFDSSGGADEQAGNQAGFGANRGKAGDGRKFGSESVSGVSDNSSGQKADVKDDRVVDSQPRAQIKKGMAELRELDKHYYTIATYRATQDQYVIPMMEYLWSQGVEVGAFHDHNSSYYTVVALRGFTREQLSQGAGTQFKKELVAVGRRWQAVDRRNSDFHDAYPVRFKGQKIQKSITKAN
jgi:hypothetical protein